MKAFYLVDLIVFLAACSAFILMPLRSEFIYQRVAQRHNYTEAKQTYCVQNNTNQTEEDQVIAKEASAWTMYINLSIFVPAMVVGALLTSWGDKVGRKITLFIPLCGMTASSILQALIILFHWPLETMLGYGAIAGGTGYFMTVLIQGTTYLSDVTPSKSRGKRFTILETFIGVGGGIAGLGGGYWIKAQGFLPSVWCTVGLTAMAQILVPFLPDSSRVKTTKALETKETTVAEDSSPINSDEDLPSYNKVENENSPKKDSDPLLPRKGKHRDHYSFADLWKAVWTVYTTEYMKCEKCFGKSPQIKDLDDRRCEHGGGVRQGRIWRLWLYVISYCAYMFTNVGIMVFQTIFFLASPLCFSAVLVGLQMSLKFMANVAGPIFVITFQRCCGLSNQSIIMLSLFAYFMFPFLMCFAHDAALVFVATSTMTLGSIAKPFMQAQVSSLASETEQGAAFALLSSSEVLSFLLATISYLTMYSTTQHISHWFTWMFSAGVALIPIALMGLIWIADKCAGVPVNTLQRGTNSPEKC